MKTIFYVSVRKEWFWLVRKGMHEKQMEQARDMLEKNIGLAQIVEETGLSESDVLKKQEKMRKKIND